jgi:hypothetical protein
VSQYKIELVRAQGISDAERWRRVCRAYDLILNFSLDDNASDSGDFGRDVLSLAHGAPTLETQTQEHYSGEQQKCKAR